MPGSIESASLNLLASSSLELADTHSFFEFKIIMTSLSSIDIGSVGTSAAPIRVTTCLTSGKLFSKICSILVVVSTVLLSDVPVFKTGCITKSPSSNVGTNSPPREIKKGIVSNKTVTARLNTIFFLLNAQWIVRAKELLSHCII